MHTRLEPRNHATRSHDYQYKGQQCAPMCRGAPVCQVQAQAATSNRPIFSCLTCASHSLLDQSILILPRLCPAQADTSYIYTTGICKTQPYMLLFCFISRRSFSTSKCSNLDVRHRRPAILFRRLLFPATLASPYVYRVAKVRRTGNTSPQLFLAIVIVHPLDNA